MTEDRTKSGSKSSGEGKKYLIVYTYFRKHIYDTYSGIQNYILTTSDDVYSENGISNIVDYLKRELEYDEIIIQNIIPLNG